MSYPPEPPNDDFGMVSSEDNAAPEYRSQLMLYFPRTANYAQGGGFFVNEQPSTSIDDYFLMQWALQKEVRVFHHPCGTTFYNHPPSDGVHYSVGTDGEFYGSRNRKARNSQNLQNCASSSEDPLDNNISSVSEGNAVGGESGPFDSSSNSSGVAPSNVWAPGGNPSDTWNNFSNAAVGQIWGPGLYSGNTSFTWSNHQIVTTGNNAVSMGACSENPPNPWGNNYSCVGTNSTWRGGLYSSNTWNNRRSVETGNIWGEGTYAGAGLSNTLSNPPIVAADNTVSPGEDTAVRDPSGSWRESGPSIQNASAAENPYEPQENYINPHPVTDNPSSADDSKQRKSRNKNKRRANKEYNQRAS